LKEEGFLSSMTLFYENNVIVNIKNNNSIFILQKISFTWRSIDYQRKARTCKIEETFFLHEIYRCYRCIVKTARTRKVWCTYKYVQNSHTGLLIHRWPLKDEMRQEGVMGEWGVNKLQV